MLSKSHRTAASIDFEQAMEEDGLFALTIWFAGAQRSYISMCCNLDIAGKVYIESDDQIPGFETTGRE